MAISKTTVSRQAPRPSPAPAPVVARREPAPSLEDARLEEVEEPAPVAAEQKPPRITVNGVGVSRLQVDFGKDTTAFHPSGSTMERFWDQYDKGEEFNRLSRPRAFCYATVELVTSKGFMDLMVTFPDSPIISRIVQPNAQYAYEP